MSAWLRRLRVTEPWRYKAPFLISVPYFILFAAAASVGDALVWILLALCTITGVAGFAYMSNDVADRRADVAAGRPNGTAELSTARTTLAFAVFLAAALAPWIAYVPADRVSVSLWAAELLLLLAYSVPPIRLKERGILGVTADALYAHVVPALLAAYSFHVLTQRVFDGFVTFAVALAAWQFFLGMRSVLTHQLSDADHDRASGTSTHVIRRGEEASMRLLKFVLLPLELTTWAIFNVVVAETMPIVAAAWAIYVGVAALVIKIRREALWQPLCDRLDLLLNEYYLRWLPLVILAGLCFRDARMIVLLVLHLAVFRNGLTPLLRRAWDAVRPAAGRLAESPAD